MTDEETLVNEAMAVLEERGYTVHAPEPSLDDMLGTAMGTMLEASRRVRELLDAGAVWNPGEYGVTTYTYGIRTALARAEATVRQDDRRDAA